MFMRQLSSKCQLWTEMVVDSTVKFSEDLDRHLGFSPGEDPLVCQLGGNSAESLASASKVVETYGYKEVNLNVGCPSPRVAECGEFGAVLMRNPSRVRDLCSAMRAAISIPLTVKTRIAVDELCSFQWCHDYIQTVAESGVQHFIMHARPAWLKKKLLPSQNRSIPPLDFDRVFELANSFPSLEFSINGGIQSLDEVENLLKIPHQAYPQRSAVAGCMIGRAASDKPAILYDVDRRIYGEKSNPSTAYSRFTVLEGYMDYLNAKNTESTQRGQGHVFPRLNPCIGLFHSTRGSKLFRQSLDSQVRKHANDLSAGEVLQNVIQIMEASCSGILHAPFDPEPAPDVRIIDDETLLSSAQDAASQASTVPSECRLPEIAESVIEASATSS
eukprot:Protomagalhaensia_sp_Gyna_25__5439@NODE_710_length_2798_cov_491_571584_g552_i0_p1_GENE_NODE_710_length_2798_cov_491_571584_g552_i0NODE_710_length_2798_cov_491_571584_g552_i0_p1_ORF_typecomplete_len422_score64_47Dus/PF01207_17/6e59DHO_dh/PF01180_21/0_011_NODE_710_length_2798_cov_491_571584_g552_i01081268